MNKKNIAIIGGGAGGYFTAINTAIKNPEYRITIFEKGKNTLGKVKISGGGRCNVTHACFDPIDLTKYYPRGSKELLGPFHTFMTGDTMEWFETRNVPLKVEEDNRVFPASDTSQSIIDCLQKEIAQFGISVQTESAITAIANQNNKWQLQINESTIEFDAVVIASGGNSKSIWENLQELGYHIVPPAPSLFTFNTKDTRLRNLSGLSVPNAKLKITGTKLSEEGPLLITHWGMSGPGVLKLSSVAARMLFENNYKFDILIDWVTNIDRDEIVNQFQANRIQTPKKTILKNPCFGLPKRLWESLVNHSQISAQKTWAELSNKEQNRLLENIKSGQFKITGKSTNKDEFVTCGGVDLKQINFTKFESRLHPNLFFVGEVLNIDALTGGFNFQAAWTGGYIVSQHI